MNQKYNHYKIEERILKGGITLPDMKIDQNLQQNHLSQKSSNVVISNVDYTHRVTRIFW